MLIANIIVAGFQGRSQRNYAVIVNFKYAVVEKNKYNETSVYSIQSFNDNLAILLACNYLAELLRDDLNGSRYGNERIRYH